MPLWIESSHDRGAAVRAALLLCVLAACACGGTPPHDEDPTLDALTLVSRSGALRVNVTSTPGPLPVRGENQLELAIERVDSAEPVDGLALELVPFMPAMGHGSGSVPQVTAMGDGRYHFDGVVLTMPGIWELRTTISGALSDYVAPRFDVP